MKNPFLELLQSISPGRDNRNNNDRAGAVPLGARSFDVFHALADNTTDLFLYFDLSPKPRIVYINPACQTVTGYPQDKFYAHPDFIFDIIAPDDIARFRELIEGDSSSQRPEPVVISLHHADGTTVWTENAPTIIFSEDGTPEAVLIISRDVTSRIKAEETRYSSQKFVSSLMEHAPYSAMVINPDTSIRYINPAWEEMNGWTLHEVIGMKAPYPWWPRENLEETMAGFLESIKLPGGNSETVAFKRNGKPYDIMFNWVSIRENDETQFILLNSMDITEKNRLQKQLEDSQEIFSAAFRSSPDMMSLISIEDGTHLEVNDSFVQYTGYSREELIGARGTEIGLWVNKADNEELTRLLEETGSVRQAEYQFRKKNGEIRTWLCSADVITISGKLCTLAVATDITERRQAQDALRESEERFYRAFNSSPGSVSISRLSDGKFIEVNESFLRDKGFTREEVIGRTATDLDMWAGDYNRTRVLELIEKQDGFQNELIDYRTKDGEIKTGYFSCDTITIGNEPCLIMQTTDITPLKKAESKLQASKEIVESILSSMPEGVLVIGNDGTVLLANNAFYHIFMTSKRSVLNRPLEKVLDVDHLNNLYREVKDGKRHDASLEFRFRKRATEKIIASVIIGMKDGQTLLTFADVSREREEETKLYLTDRLASIGEMAAGLAHELNNPLTGILAMSQMLLESDMTDDQREDILSIYDEARRAAGIVKNVLLFTRNTNTEYGRSNVEEVIKDVLRLREYEAKINNITVVVDVENGLSDIAIDRYQFQQVFLNLVLNAEAAIKESNRAGLLTISAYTRKDQVTVDITDNGCGIKKTVLPRIFDPFFTTKEIGKGTGLGLSICYGIVVKHGGKLDVSSKVNEGTTFSITLPLYAANGKSRGTRA